MLQDMQSEVPSQEALLESLETRAESLYFSASEEKTAELRDLHCNLEERWCSLSTNIPLRIQELQSHLSKLEQFSQISLALTQWSEDFLRHIQSTCKVSITDLQSADSKTKEDRMSLQTQGRSLDALQPHLDVLGPSLAPKDLQNLQTRKEDCLQLFSEAQSLLEHRDEALLKLIHFCEIYNKARTSLHTIQDAVEGRGSWDDSKVREINQELGELAKELACLEVQAISLDIVLNKAHFHLHGAEEERTSCRGLVDDVALSVQVLQRSIGTKQSEAEALATMWSSFRGRKELLLESLAKLENRANIPWPTEASTHSFQQRLWLLKQLEEELQALQHSQLWLGERGEQLAHRDSELAGEAQRDVALVQSTWERIRAIIVEDHDLCANLLELCREYQTLRTRISSVVERAHAITVAHSDPHNPEDIRRALSRLEAVRPELAATKEELNKLIGSGKHLTGVLKKLPEESFQSENVTTEIDAIVDQWLDISERMDADISLYTRSLDLWNDINKIANEIECWSAISVCELSEGAASLLSTHDMEEHLSDFKLELDSKEDELKTLQAKMTQLQELMKTQHIHTELQVMAADLRKQIFHAGEVYEQTKGMYKDFNSQRQQLQDLISQISEQLKTSEDSLSEFSSSSDPMNLVKIKEVERSQKQLEVSLEVASESLRALCRTYPTQHLTLLGDAISHLVKRNEDVTQHRSQILGSLQDALLQCFSEKAHAFHCWLSELRAGIEDCFEQTGDAVAISAKQQKLKTAVEEVTEGEERLAQVCEDGERLLLHLGKCGTGSIQEQLDSCQYALDSFVMECRQRVRSLEESANLLNVYETHAEELSGWLQQLEVRLKTDVPLWGESQSAAPDCSEELRRVEEIHRELLMRRASLEHLCHSSLTVTERGSSSKNVVAAELLSNHEALLQEARGRLRSLQEYQAFEEALKAVETWLKDVERKLEELENTEGNKKEVEEKLERAQDILLMKGEGEVKLNMAAGKAELVIKSSGEVERGVICSKLQDVEDAWAALLLRAMSCHSRLEWTVNQWDLFVESRAQLQRWLEGVGLEVKGPLEPQLGLREKRKQLERLRLLSSDVEDHQGALCYLEESAAELYKRTSDPVFKEEEMVLLRAQFEDVKAAAEERVRLSEDVVLEHKKYMETIRELTDWLMVVGEELQQCSDPSGDSPTLSRKLTEVRELLERGACEGRERLRRVRLSAERAGRHTAAAGCELMDGEVAALARALHQWEGASLRARDALETAVAAATGAEREQTRLTAQLEGEMEKLEGQLKEWSEGLSSAERRNSGAAAVEGWTVAKGVMEGLQTAEVMEEKLKAQLNELCGFSSDLGPQSDRVSALIKLHNSLSLRASRECQNKEKLLEQRFRSSLHDFRQWMVNANISTAKCFDSPHSIQDASIALQRIQEFRSDKEQGQTRLNAVLTYGEQLSSVVPADRVEAIRTKANTAKDDWKSLMDSLQRRDMALQVLQSQMQDFEASVEPLQDWLNRTEISVQESSARLHDLPAKRLELSKLQTLLEEMRSRESELAELRGRAHGLWEGQGAGKSFVHRVCQLAACYLALSNLIKEKVSRVERVVGEHQLFSQGLQELQNWVSESQQVLKTCRCPTSNKSVLITRMGQLETLLAACQGREIQLKMLITRGESVQRNTSAEGVPVVRKQIQDLKDSWESLLSTSIQCKSQLEGALSHWTSYQEDVSQFECWMERVEESLGNSDKHYAEMRDKTANLGRAKLLYEEVLSHSSPLETIATKGSNMTEHTATQQEIQKLSERYTAIKDKAKAAVSKAEELVLLHQEYQRGLHMFEDWLEQEQNSLALLSPLDEDVNSLENTLKELQMLQSHCPKGHNLLSSVLASRERVVPWGAPQIEDRALETAQTEWQGYQDRLAETKVQVEQALARVQQLEGLFQSLDQWLVDMELKVKVRSHRRSDVTAKEAQLQHLKRWQIEAAQRQAEVEGLSTLAQQVVEDAHVSGRISTRVTQLTARYHALLILIQDTLKQLQEEIQNITEAQNALRTFSDWLSTARKNFKIVTERTEALDRITMEKKMKRLESLQGDMDQGHSLLKTLREGAEQAVSFLDDPGASRLEREVQTGRSQLEELILGLREEHATLERSIVLYKDFQERYKSQMQWLRETRALLCSTVEPKAELYQRKAQLNKYKAVEQTLLSRDSAVSFVLEKGETLLTLLHSPSITDNMTKLQADYKELCGSARTHVHRLDAQVKKQEVYHKDLQDIERWLLQMSSRMVTPDPSSGGGLEAATQQLARHKAIMEEIAGFEERLATLKEKGEELLSGCSERLQARLRQQIQNHQQGARDSYSAICSTAQRVYQSLDRELQKHVSVRDTLQQCQMWLSNVQEEIQLPAHAPHCLKEAQAQIKQERTLQEQASTYLQLVCSTCDLSDEKVRETAAGIQQVKLQIEEKMLESQELADNWREIKDLRSNLECHLLEAEQLLQSMLRRPAELEPKVAQNQLDQAQDFIQEMRARQVDLTQLRESINRLTAGQESPELMEVGRLRCAWLDLGRQAAQLLEQKEEDLQRSGDYHDCICMVEELFDQLSKKWDQLARGDIESTAECLDALKKLSTDLQDQRCVLDDLRNNRHGILPRLSLEDRDLVKEQVGYLEQRWTQVESLVQQKIQDSAQTLEELSQIEDHLREAQEWAELQQPSLSEVLKTSPPPDLAQSFLFDHLSFCAELEAKQKVLAEAVTDANSLSSRLGLNERRKLQTLVQEAQAEVETLGIKAVQYRKSLSKVFTERTQFLQALDRATEWIRKQEQRALADDHVALLPNVLHKQVSACKNFTSSLRAYQVELTSLWVQGRELVKDATAEEKKETLQKLEELQVTFEASLQKSTEHLQHLEKALVIRKYFKVDLDRICEWLKQAEVATFPIIDLSGNDEELQNQLIEYQQLLDHASEYENLLLIVQRAGQEILPTLNEVDHCYLDEKLNGLPQQYNDMLLLIREKRDRIQQVLLERREFESLIDATRKALKELQEKCDGLEMKSANQSVEEGERLHSSYEDLMKGLANLFQGMKDLRGKTQNFLIIGQPYAPEVIDQLVHLHTSLNQQIEGKMKELGKTLKILHDHQAVIEKMDCSITTFKEQLGKFDSKGAEEADAMETISTLHNLSKCLEEVSSYPEGLKAHNVDLNQHFDSKALKTQVIFREEQLLTLKQKINAHIEEFERDFRENKDFQTDIKVSIEWLKSLRHRLRYPLMFDEAKIEIVQEEVRSLSALQEQMKSRFRLLEYMTNEEKQKYVNDQKPFPKLLETTLMDIPKLKDDLQQAVNTKQVALQTVLSLLQRYHHSLQSVQQCCEDAGAVLEHPPQEVDLEKISDCLKDLKNITDREHTVKCMMQEIQGLVPEMGGFVSPVVINQIQQRCEDSYHKVTEVFEQLKQRQDNLQRSITQWRCFQGEIDEVIRQMNEVEKRMKEFTTARANSEQEAEDKLCLYQNIEPQVQSLEYTLTGLKEKATQLDQPAIKDTTSRSLCSLSHRLTRLLSVARAQGKALQDSACNWTCTREKLEKMRAVCEDLHSRVPDNMVEKTSSMAALQSLLEYHDSFSREVERESSALTLLRHHVLNLFLHPCASASSTDSKHNQDNPCLLEIQSIQEKYDNLLQQVCASRQQVQVELREREEVVRELGLLKGWIQDTQGLLLSPTADLDNLLTDLETAHEGMRSHRQNLEQIADHQQIKYQDLNATLPSEISTQLAEVTLALGSAEDQVQAREREVQHSRDIKEDFNSRLQDISKKVKLISLKLKQKAVDVEEAKEETESLFEELEECGRALSELDVAVQEFGEQNPLLAKQLGSSLSKLTELHAQTSRLAEGRTTSLQKAEKNFEGFNEMLTLTLNWTEKAETVVSANIMYSPASQMQEQIRTHQALLQEWQDLQGEFEGLVERVALLGEVVQTDALHQQVSELSRHAEELQQRAKTRLLMLQDAAKDLGRLESDVKSLHQAIERVQETLASPDLARLSLREQLVQRQLLLSEMEGLKQQVQAMQMCQSALRLPEDVIAALPLCVTAQSLQQESSQLQHNTIQQCNILQEAMVQYEQYEQEVKNLQRLIEEAHRVIQDRPVATGNIQELQTQIQHHEELALKIKGYQEQISALNSKCKMLTVKAKHATMLLTVSEVDGLSDGLEELEDEEEEMPKHPPAHPSVVMMTAGRCHTLLSPVTEESGEEGTNSEVSSPPTCRSPSPGPNADTSQGSGRAPLSRAPLQELYDPSMESAASANLDDLQRSWETLKNVISEKQKSLYEALERQQHYQETLQSVSTKMESIETALNEGLEPSKSPESQMAAHQALMDEILMLQDEINALQACFSQELQLDEDSLEADAGDQLALQSTLTVLGERMATIHMKASGKRQLLEERLSEQLEEQRQEQALQRYHSEAEELDNWLLSTRATLSSTLQPHPQDMDMEEQLIDCQNMLLEIEQKVLCLSELSVHSESLLMEGKAGTRGDAEQLSLKLHSLKSSLLELQRILQDKQTHIQGSLQEQEDIESDSSLSQSPNMMDWLSQARSTRNQQHQDTVQRQRELEEQFDEQKKLLQSVASRGEEILSQRTTPNGERSPTELSEGDAGQWPESMSTNDQMRVRWENLSKALNNKLDLNTMEQTACNTLYQPVSSPCGVFRGEQSQDILSPRSLFEGFSQDLDDLPQTSGADSKRAHALKRTLYEAVSSASSWLDSAENELVSGPILLSDDSETHLGHLESLNKEVKNVNEEVCKCQDMLGRTEQLWDGKSGESVLVEKVLNGLEGRLKLLDTVLEQRCDTMKDKLQELTLFQAEMKLLLTALNDSKYQLLQKMNAAVDRPASKQMEILAEAEDSLREFEQKVSEMRSRGEILQPNQLCTQELLKLQDAYEELVEMVGSKRSGLNQSLVLKAQYERALQDLVDLLDTAQDKMAADQKMKVGSVIEVQILLDKHKEFFQGLETHVVLTQAFFRQVSGLVVQREVQSLEETVAQAQAVLKQAHKRGVELEGILEWWSRLVGDYQALYRQLEAVESNIPSVGLVEETEDRLSDRIALYQRLKASLSERQQQLYKLLEDGKRLLLHVSCSELETQLTQLGDHWLSTTTKINKELHRLDSTLKHWIRYQSESAEISQWLSSALDRLEFWSTQSVTVPQELETVRDHLHAFLEFSKEVDAKSSLRASVQSQGNQLLRLKKVDTAALRANLAQVETQWADLLTRIPVVQEKLHQLQMEKLPSRHAITELMSWITLMENIIQEDQQKIMGAVGSESVQMYLQKYKGFRIDLSCKQLTVDFVNQSVLQISSQDVEGKRSDKTDFAERLGAMNRRWQILQGLVTEKIQVLEGLLESWLDYENVVQTLKTWFSVQEEKLKKNHRIEDVSSAQNALKDCQEMEVLVKEKEKDLEKAEEKGCLLIQDKKGEAGSVIMDTLKGLNQSWANLDHMIGQQTVCLRSVLEQWSLYKQAYEEIQGYLMEGRYTISRLRLLTGSPEAVQVQVENLESLQDELEKQESSLRKLGSITHQLLTDCHPSVSNLLNTALGDVNVRWNTLLEQISDQLRRSKSLLQLWQHYKALHAQSSTDIQKLEEQVEQLLKSATNRGVTEQEVKGLMTTEGSVESVLQQLDEFSEQLRQQVDPSAMTTFHTDHLSLTQRLATVGHTLQRQQSLLEAGMKDYERFSKELHSLSHWSEEAEKVLKEPDPIGSPDMSSVQEHMEKLKTQMLKLSSLSPDLDRLNELGYQLPLNDNEIKRLQNLNRSWSSNSARTTERFSKLQALVLQRQTFLEKCDAWMTFLTQTEEKLAAEISGNYQSLLDQQREHELFQAEMFSRQQILYSIINDGHQLLNQGQVEDRDDFGLKLAQLSNQWQGVVRRAQQRRGIIDSLVRQWQRYTELIEKLRHWLQEVSVESEDQHQGSTVALQQIRGMLDQIQLKERVLQRQQGSYILTVEAGRQLLLWADGRAEASLHTELTDVQEHWRTINIRLDERKKELLSLLRDWDQCEKGIAASHEKLRDFKQKLSVPLPDHHEELHTEQIRCKELESSIEGWADDVAGLFILRDSLSSGLSADDLTVLQERLVLLQRQWEETCHQLSLRRQQVSERLNEWAVFNEKNKELCEWLTQMESKVSQNGDISIEEMIEKLRKDYQEEISVAKENKHQLEQMGERLAQASHESKAAEIQYKLSKVNERWQHLLDLIEARVKKLRETLVAVQQLDKNMSSLRSWLAHIETELSRPIVYETCDSHEIQRKLNQQQELQRDIEKHSTGVASVLNLCEVLLHDCDACATETECESIQQATRGLDRRWRNICAIAMERRLKIEETWRLWQKFLDDYSRFEEWLKVSERTAALPNSSGVLYTVAKEELKKFEAFQRQVQECLTQLELINKQYRRLARENRTDSSCHLRQMVHDGNRRWDVLQRRVAAILRRLKHFIGQREEFETARDGILVWLTEMDLQLTNIEHFSECDVQAKIKQLKAFQQEISLNMGKMESVFGQGEVLMEKSEPLDAAVIEEELDELQRYCREVFGRVERYYRKLTRLPLIDDEFEGSDREFESGDISDLQWGEDGTLSQTSSRPSSGGTAPVCTNGSGRDTPASVDSIPLEWDHDYDLDPMGHTMSAQQGRQKDEDEELLCLATAALTGEAVRLLDNIMDTSRYSLEQTDGTMGVHGTSYMGYMRLMDDCRGSLKAVRRVEGELEEEEDNLSGLSNPDNTETQSTGVIERWELIQAQSAGSDHKEREDLVLLQKMTSDLDAMEAWLGQAEMELEELRGKTLSADIHTIEQRIRKLKDLQKAMDSHKSKVLSINLNSVTLLQSDSEESKGLKAKVKEMNSRWDRLGKSLKDWRTALQDSLMQCQEFHELSHGLLLWLENIDRRRNEIIPIASGLDRHTLQAHYRALKQIQRELLETEQKVDSLQELSGQLLVQSHGSECLEAQERVHVIGNRLHLLLKAVATDLELLGKELQASGNRQDASLWPVTDDADTSGSVSPASEVSVSTKRQSLRGKCSVSEPGSSARLPRHRLPSGSGCVSSRSGSSGSQGGAAVARCQPFLLRVLRAALPLQLLLLLIVGLTCLVPTTEQDYSCAHANNFARSFHPMLRYTNGPPPV
ncbi:nesprin-1 isoform X1 [Puntigrus tetrazona]|uniref:nesprin-1-like isoform X1 n=1 Tax=Puntigrus tetrazona TaxID=1606681 RepID=UPI001C8A82AC|nr:nesprin-1-like isoform X1 [Puntigrus tetrazona]XP_043075796.1 nesprin-1 isoform X1 [Puntigrus tetrazona]